MAKCGQFTGVGQTTREVIKGVDPVNLSITGGSGTFAPQWFVCNDWKDIKTYAATDIADAFTDVAQGTRVRAKCVTYVSGPIDWEIG